MAARQIALIIEIGIAVAEKAVVSSILVGGVTNASIEVQRLPGNPGQFVIVDKYAMPILETALAACSEAEPDLVEEIAQTLYVIPHVEAVSEIMDIAVKTIESACERARKAQDAFDNADLAAAGFGARSRRRGGLGGAIDLLI